MKPSVVTGFAIVSSEKSRPGRRRYEPGVRSKLCWIEARGERVVAAEIYVVESGCVAAPAWGVAFFHSYHVGGGAHLHAALAERAADQAYFHFDSGAILDLAGCQEKYPGRADIFRHQSNGEGLGLPIHFDQPQWKI